MFCRAPAPPALSPMMAPGPMLCAHVVSGPRYWDGDGLAGSPLLGLFAVVGKSNGVEPTTTGYAGVASVSSSISVQLRLPEPPWPACTNQSSPNGASVAPCVAFWTSFCIEIEPSEQVVWLWK